MTEQAGCWVEILANNDAEALWEKLFRLVSRHSSIRNLFNSNRTARSQLHELHTDITQDLFLRLHRKGRWQHYMDAAYLSKDIEHELYHIEIPNLVSLLLRERHPEAYRLSRRISDLIQSRPEFQRYGRPEDPDGRRTSKLTLKIYGLSEWPLSKTAKPHQDLHGLIQDVSCRSRDRRRAGRGSSSQIIISNSDLTDLLVEIFRAMDSPCDIRMVRSLALSRIAIEDSRFVSIDAALSPDADSVPEPLKVDFADLRPTPEEILLENESTNQVEAIAVELLDKMHEVVRNKPNRFSRLAKVAWHCYFDLSSPSQTTVARMIGISNSLVSHYRKLFDSVIREVELDEGQYIPFLHTFGARLEKSIRANSKDTAAKPERYVHAPYRAIAQAAAASRFS
jgi:hypothetical protein